MCCDGYSSSSDWFWCVWFFFFFKQKTAYEMRISDWSSDVCSSDLDDLEFDRRGGARAHPVGRDDLADRQVGARQRRPQDRRLVDSAVIILHPFPIIDLPGLVSDQPLLLFPTLPGHLHPHIRPAGFSGFCSQVCDIFAAPLTG